MGRVLVCMEEVYIVDMEDETILGVGKRNESGEVVVSVDLERVNEFEVVPVIGFYEAECLDGIVAEGLRGTQVHVECMKCGFETVYGVKALMRERGTREGYPKKACQECGANAWREVERQTGTCDWSDSFDWAEPPER